jgi:hypothetical protein
MQQHKSTTNFSEIEVFAKDTAMLTSCCHLMGFKKARVG